MRALLRQRVQLFVLLAAFFFLGVLFERPVRIVQTEYERALVTIKVAELFPTETARKNGSNGTDELFLAVNSTSEAKRQTPAPNVKIPKRFLIEESDFCSQRHPGLHIIAYVHSAISKVNNRMITRRTWANATAQGFALNLAVVFMVGRAKGEVEEKMVQEESHRYHDIIQIDHDDDYRLLSYKALGALNWIVTHCPGVPWTIHSDDDTLIDPFLLASQLRNLNAEAVEKIVCTYMGGPVLRQGRWRVDPEEYPAERYPEYCSGGVWLVQTKQIPRFLEASKTAPFVWVDDAYLLGILRKQAGIQRLSLHQNYSHKMNLTKHLGKVFAWLYPGPERERAWPVILEYHRNASSPFFRSDLQKLDSHP